MKILSKNLKEQTVKLLVETPEDLWHIEHVIFPGNLVRSKTMRKTSIKRGGEYEYGEKKPMVLTVQIEKIELRTDSATLRITGLIVEGPENVEKSYHSMEFEIGSVLTIKKDNWKKHELERLEKAKVKKSLLLVCVLDREDADFAILRESGIEMKARITNHDKENMENYHKRIISYLNGSNFEIIVIAGPGFERENLSRYIEQNDKALAKKIIVEHSSANGINGIHEVIKKSANRILKETRVSKESNYVNELMARMKSGGLAVYGPKQTENAVNMGAVETLFISQEKINDYEKLMEVQEKMRGRVVIIGNDHELGEQFLYIGGIGGYLRFKLDF
ncbi:MAG: mRNA surveillance protein pelota [Candidatus Aenigmarchaeota archaeon]|nr:mRNA surveillance protein pelota [Candidatus Aenigmarchaeota archaeon]